MNPLFGVIAVLVCLAQLVVPLRLAFLPVLLAACHLPNMSILGVGSADFSITRVLIALALMRAVVSGRLVWSLRNPLDALVFVWGCVAILSSFAHHSEDFNPLVFRMGLVFDAVGSYLIARVSVSDMEGLMLFSKCLVIVLVPLAVLMLFENLAGRNPYSLLGESSPDAIVREGRVRSRGSFSTAIHSGTVGGGSFLLVFALWNHHRRWAIVGAGACVLITVCSSSSGPMATLLLSLMVLGLWRWRSHLSLMRWAVVLALVALDVVMKDRVWYLMARIDLVGGSGGWHRAELISAGLKYLNEWWLAGTDYTRHWMPSGVSWSEDHTDITNHYLRMGVLGGLPLLLALCAILYKAFQLLGRWMAQLRQTDQIKEFVLWCVGGSLFAHSATFISVSYFDPKLNAVFWLGLGLIHGLGREVEEQYDEESLEVDSAQMV